MPATVDILDFKPIVVRKVLLSLREIGCFTFAKVLQPLERFKMSSSSVLSVRQLWNDRRDQWWLPVVCEVEETDWTAAISGDLQVIRGNTGFTLKGDLTVALQIRCDYCEKPLPETQTLSLDESFVIDKFIVNALPKEIEVHPKDFFETIAMNGDLDIGDVCRQLLLFSLEPPFWCKKLSCPDLPAYKLEAVAAAELLQQSQSEEDEDDAF
jgi:hypothetical protein